MCSLNQLGWCFQSLQHVETTWCRLASKHSWQVHVRSKPNFKRTFLSYDHPPHSFVVQWHCVCYKWPDFVVMSSSTYKQSCWQENDLPDNMLHSRCKVCVVVRTSSSIWEKMRVMRASSCVWIFRNFPICHDPFHRGPCMFCMTIQLHLTYT